MDANKGLALAHLDLSWNKGDFDGLRAVWAADCTLHLPGGVTLEGIDAMIAYLRAAVGAYSARVLVVNDVIEEGSTLATRWTFSAVQVPQMFGVAANTPVTFTGMDFYRVREGKLIEEWFETNMMAVLQEIATQQRSD